MRNGIKLDLISYCLVIIFLFSSGCGSENQQDRAKTPKEILDKAMKAHKGKCGAVYKDGEGRRFSWSMSVITGPDDKQMAPPGHRASLINGDEQYSFFEPEISDIDEIFYLDKNEDLKKTASCSVYEVLWRNHRNISENKWQERYQGKRLAGAGTVTDVLLYRGKKRFQIQVWYLNRAEHNYVPRVYVMLNADPDKADFSINPGEGIFFDGEISKMENRSFNSNRNGNTIQIDNFYLYLNGEVKPFVH